MPSDHDSGDFNSAARARHALLGELFNEALELDPDAREASCRRGRPTTRPLRRQLEDLLAAAARPRIVEAIERRPTLATPTA